MAIQVGNNHQVFPNGAIADAKYFDDGTVQWTITPAPGDPAKPALLPPGYPAAFPGAVVKPIPPAV